MMKVLLPFFLLMMAMPAIGQNITGTWEGRMGQEYLQISLVQRGNEVCGQTYDYEVGNPQSFCRTLASGKYMPDRGIYSFTGNRFIINSGSHVLMAMRLWRDPADGPNYLRGIVGTLGGGGYFSTTEEILLKKVSSRIVVIPDSLPPCFPKTTPPPPVVRPFPRPAQKPAPPVAKTPVTKKPAPKTPVPITPAKPTTASKAPMAKTPAKPATKPPVTAQRPPATKPTPAPVTKAPPVATKPVVVSGVPPKVLGTEALRIKDALETRKNTEQSRITISEKTINLKLYDNGEIDNDTVSVFYNGTLIVSHQRLTDRALEIEVPINTSLKEHKITLFAENLGSIPPNTALIVVTSGKKRYELRSKADLSENAVLVFEYVPAEE